MAERDWLKQGEDFYGSKPLPRKDNYTEYNLDELQKIFKGGSKAESLDEYRSKDITLGSREFYEAAQKLADIQTTYYELAEGIRVGSEELFKNWSGPAATAGHSVIQQIHDKVASQYKSLADAPRGANTAWGQVHHMAKMVDWAKQAHHTISGHYFGFAKTPIEQGGGGARTSVTDDGLHKTHLGDVPGLKEKFAHDLGNVLNQLADQYVLNAEQINIRSVTPKPPPQQPPKVAVDHQPVPGVTDRENRTPPSIDSAPLADPNGPPGVTAGDFNAKNSSGADVPSVAVPPSSGSGMNGGGDPNTPKVPGAGVNGGSDLDTLGGQGSPSIRSVPGAGVNGIDDGSQFDSTRNDAGLSGVNFDQPPASVGSAGAGAGGGGVAAGALPNVATGPVPSAGHDGRGGLFDANGTQIDGLHRGPNGQVVDSNGRPVPGISVDRNGNLTGANGGRLSPAELRELQNRRTGGQVASPPAAGVDSAPPGDLAGSRVAAGDGSSSGSRLSDGFVSPGLAPGANGLGVTRPGSPSVSPPPSTGAGGTGGAGGTPFPMGGSAGTGTSNGRDKNTVPLTTPNNTWNPDTDTTTPAGIGSQPISKADFGSQEDPTLATLGGAVFRPDGSPVAGLAVGPSRSVLDHNGNTIPEQFVDSHGVLEPGSAMPDSDQDFDPRRRPSTSVLSPTTRSAASIPDNYSTTDSNESDSDPGWYAFDAFDPDGFGQELPTISNNSALGDGGSKFPSNGLSKPEASPLVSDGGRTEVTPTNNRDRGGGTPASGIPLAGGGGNSSSKSKVVLMADKSIWETSPQSTDQVGTGVID